MRRAERVHVATGVVDIAVPSQSGRTAGISMAGFHGRANGPVDLQVIPYPALTIFIDFGDMLLFDSAAAGRTQGSVVVGLGSGSIRAEVCKRAVECLQIRLSPVVAHAVFGTNPELGGTVVALEELWGRDAARTQEKLHAAASWDDRFTIVEAMLAQRCETGGSVDPEVAFIWEQMVTSRGRVRIERLAADVGWSRKRLWSRFRTQIGLAPKCAARLVRFDYAAHRLAAGHSAAVVAAESGFADQSHLHGDVMAFAGLTPTAVAAAPWLVVDDVAWPAPERSPGCGLTPTRSWR